MGQFNLNVVCGFTVIFLIGPLVVVVIASFTSSDFITIPPVGLSLRWYYEAFSRKDLIDSFYTSMIVASAVSMIATGLGTLSAMGLNANVGIGRTLLAGLIVSPLILPTVVTGVALYSFVQSVELQSTYVSLIIGHSLITIPYVVRTVGATLVGLDKSLAEAAETLGASPAMIFRKVTAPAIAPAIAVSILMSFIVSFDQVTMSIFMSDPDTTTLPVRLYNYLQYSLDPMVAAVSSLMILFAYMLVITLEWCFGLGRLFARS